MKRIAFILAIVLTLSLVSCGNREDEQTTTKSKENVGAHSTNQKTEKNDPQDTPEDEALYDNWVKISGESIYLNYKSGRRKQEAYSSLIFSKSLDELIVWHFNTNDPFDGSAEDVFAFLNQSIMFDELSIYSGANFFDVNKNFVIEPKSTKTVALDNITAVQIEGSVTDADGRVCFAYGYTFVMDDVPCFLVGFVFTEAQEQNLIDSIKKEVDTMIKTVRSER